MADGCTDIVSHLGYPTIPTGHAYRLRSLETYPTVGLPYDFYRVCLQAVEAWNYSAGDSLQLGYPAILQGTATGCGCLKAHAEGSPYT